MAKTKGYGFGIRGDIPADAAESRIIPFILSTFAKDRHGTVLNQDNWKLDNYRLNPVIAYQHNLSGGMCTDPNPDFVIGKSVSIGMEGQAQDRRLIAAVEFEPASVNPLAEKIFQKVLFGSLSRSSVGFLEVGEGRYGEGEEAQGRSEETYYFAGQELLEASIVNIPSNPQAGKRDITQRRLREEGYIAFMYAFRELGGKFRLSELEAMTVRDILTLLDGKDLEIPERDPAKVREILEDPQAVADQIARLQSVRKLRVNSLKG
jgi:hypothetical protein